MKKENSTIKHFLVVGFGTIISAIISIISTPIITRLIDTANYGEFSMFQTYASIGLMVLCLGLDQSLMRFYYDTDDPIFQKKIIKVCTIIPLACTAILGLLLAVLTWLGVMDIGLATIDILLLCICIIFQITNRISLVTLRLEFKSKAFSFINILHKIVNISVVLILYFSIKDISGFHILAISMILSYAIASFVAIFFRKKYTGEDNHTLEVNYVKKMVRYGLPYIISMGLTTLFQAIDKISLDIFDGHSQVGIYASALAIVNIFVLIQTTFNSLWTPLALKHYKINKEDKKFFIKVNDYITVIMFFFGISLILFKDIIALFLGPQYREAVFILPCLIFNPIMYTISETTVCGIVFKKKSSKHLIIAGVSCLVNIIGNLILVPKLSGIGAAISTGLSYIVFFTLRTLISNVYYKVDFNLKKIYLITAISFAYALYNTFNRINPISIILYILIIAVIAILYKKEIIELANLIKKNIFSKKRPTSKSKQSRLKQ